MAEKQSRSGLTVFGQVVFGTIEYAPPEQRGLGYGQPSARSDIFTFSATMYRLWTANSPHHFRERDLPPVSALRDLLFECVNDNPTQRPESVQQLIERLKVILEAQLRKQQAAERQVKAERLMQEQQAIEAERQAEEAERLRK